MKHEEMMEKLRPGQMTQAQISKQVRGGKRRTRQTEFDKESVRRFALCCLATIATLKQSDRRRVLEHALKVNKA
jgi:hypothetical protein